MVLWQGKVGRGMAKNLLLYVKYNYKVQKQINRIPMALKFHESEDLKKFLRGR